MEEQPAEPGIFIALFSSPLLPLFSFLPPCRDHYTFPYLPFLSGAVHLLRLPLLDSCMEISPERRRKRRRTQRGSKRKEEEEEEAGIIARGGGRKSLFEAPTWDKTNEGGSSSSAAAVL